MSIPGPGANGTNGVSWRWLVGAMFSVLLLGGGSWMTYMAAEVRGLKGEQAADRKQAADQAGSVIRIEEKVRRLEQDTSEIKNDLKDQGRKLDELLRRVR